MNTSTKIPIAILAAGVIIAGAVYITVSKGNPTITANPALVRPINATDHILGNPLAKVKIIEYSDFDCAFCKDFHQTMRRIIANEGADGNVAWVLRAFPLSEIHPNALSHARAAECVAHTSGNDAFWRFADTLFARQPVNPSDYSSVAAVAGISGDFATCYANIPEIISARIAADRQNALDIGAQGTPYSLLLVAGQAPVIMDGAYSYDAVKQLIDQALQ